MNSSSNAVAVSCGQQWSAVVTLRILTFQRLGAVEGAVVVAGLRDGGDDRLRVVVARHELAVCRGRVVGARRDYVRMDGSDLLFRLTATLVGRLGVVVDVVNLLDYFENAGGHSAIGLVWKNGPERLASGFAKTVVEVRGVCAVD